MKLDKRKCRGRKNINTQMDYRVDREGKNEKKEREKEREITRESKDEIQEKIRRIKRPKINSKHIKI